MSEGEFLHLTTVTGILLFKLSVLVVGYLICKLGYKLFIKGITGGFKLHANIEDSKLDLVSASPGLFFILMGAILIATSIIKDNNFITSIDKSAYTATQTDKKDFPVIKELTNDK